jgi:hypothetical protein
MRNITYKYNLGDVVKFKDKFHSPTCGLKGFEGTTGVVEERRDYNGPCYKLAGMDSFCKESCFEGPALSKNFTCRDETVGANTLQGPETKCDTESSGESGRKWYRISFSAKLTADDLRAMKKCFFDAMNESMEIYDLEGLVIEEV